MRKRLPALFLSLALIVSCLPLGVTAEGTGQASTPAPLAASELHSHADSHVCEDCKDGTVQWTAWEKTTELPVTTGHYYLTGNVTVSKRWAVSGTNQVALCLNGYTIDANSKTAYEVAGTGKLVISDCTAYTDADGNYVAGSIIGGSDVNVGGAFYLQGSGQLYMYGGKLTGHKNTQTSTSMGYSGGAIHARGNAYVFLKDCEVSGNQTTAEGGAICLRETGATGDTAASAYLENVTFKNNYAERKGGAIFLNSAKNSVTMKSCTFEGNTSAGSGGVVYSNYGSVTVEECTFKENSCTNNGGIFHMYDGSLTVTGGTFTGKTGGSSAKNGGLIYMNKSAEVTVNSGSFQGFTVSNLGGIAYISESNTLLLVKGGTFSGNQGRNGGAFAVETGGTFKITGGTVKDNTATNKAGGVYVNGTGATFILENAELSGNTAPNGGGVYAETKAVLTLRSGKIVNNTVTGKGGGIYCVAGSTVNVSGSLQVSGNTANGAANNIYLPGEQVITLGTVSAGTGRIGVTTDASTLPHTFTTDKGTQDCASYFFSDDTQFTVATLDNKLVITLATNHSHCDCAAMGTDYCDHTQQKWTPWLDSGKLPTTSGYYYLETDVKLTGRQTVTGTNDVHLCLNGHTVDANKTVTYEVNTDGKLTVTDCGSTGSIVNGSNANVGGAFYAQGNGRLTVFGTTLSGHANTQTSTSAGYSGGAVHGRGNATILMVGTVFENNTTTAEGGAVCIRGTTTAVMENVTFRNNTADRKGGAIYTAESTTSLTLKNCTFTGNAVAGDAGGAICGPGTLTVTGCTFIGNTARYNGGAIMRNGGVLTVTDSRFEGNTGADGGAIRITSGGTLTVTGSTFTGNEATSNGGAVSSVDTTAALSGNTFHQNTAEKAAGAIYFQGKGRVLTLTDSDFTENVSVSGGGGAIQVLSGADLQLISGTFTGNACTNNNGGAIYISNESSMTMEDGLIEHNTSNTYGAGIYVLGGSLTVNGGSISENTAPQGAGIAARAGVRTVDGQQVRDVPAAVTINGGSVSGNTATTYGGGVLVYGQVSTFTMTGGEISGNTSKTSRGGGLCLQGAVGTLKGGAFTGNTAGTYGGGIYCMNIKESDVNYRPALNIYDTTVSGNSSLQGGGGIATAQTDILMEGGKITGNSTPKSCGGFLAMSESVMKMTGGEITKNTAQITCGGLYMNGSGKLTMEGGSISYNQSTYNGAGLFVEQGTAVLSGGQISYNTSVKGSGGGIYLQGTTATLRGTSVIGNYAKSNAGGIAVSRYKNTSKGLDIMPMLTISGSTIAYNTSDGPAGGVLIQSPGVTNFYSGSIRNNESKGNGGGIYVSTDHTFNMSGGKVENNQANQGAGIYHLNSIGNYTGGSVTGNKAAKNGGGMVLTGTTNVTMKDMQITENEGWTAGGIILNNSNVKFLAENCNISSNKAFSGHGGGLYAVWGITDAQLTGCTLANNYAELQGGAIATANGLYITFTDCVITNNQAGKEGGAVYTKAPLTFDGCTISNNIAGSNGGAFCTGPMGTSSVLHPVLQIKNCTVEQNESDGQGGALYLASGSLGSVENTVMQGNVSKLEGSAVWAIDDLALADVTVTGNTSKSGGYALYYNDAEYDGHSYFRGLYKMDGQMIVKDNEGGDIYMGNQVALSTGTQGLTGDTELVITLHSGVLTQLFYGAYDYEGGDLHYTVTAGDRSLTDPEEVPGSQVQEQEQDTESASGDIWLYAGIGVVVLAAIAGVILVILKKKKSPAGEGK